MFQRTTAINKILKLNKFYKGVQGGTSAGKTYGIIPVLINRATQSKVHISVVSESLPHLRRGAMKDFKDIMANTGRFIDSRWNKTESTYSFGNGSVIEFFGADSSAKLRGARRDILYVNECNNVKFESFNELASRTKEAIYLDWNPVNTFWFHEHLMNDSDADMLIINYLDNEACPQSAKDFILKAKEKALTSDYWANWYRVYGLGEVGSLQGTIYEFNTVDTYPTNAELIGYGLDFGFSSDPTALVKVGRLNGELFFDEKIYSKRLTNSDIIEMLVKLGISKNEPIIADSAEPKSIEDLMRAGYNVKGAIKGADSINNGVSTLQQFKINVTKQSINVINEMRNYCWERKDGKDTNNPIDDFNHAMDAVRYVALNKLRAKAFFDFD
ncbi:MAG: PBSX family phage terminase large subunit [Bacteroidia bacterium]|nr:PBSX family phage terminase large subunit [Bacteroidia bacterium]